MIKAGVIGLGKMGLSHCGIIGGLSNVHLQAVCDTSKLVIKAFEKYTKADCYKDYKKLIDSADIDLLYIASPPQHHGEYFNSAIKINTPVFCEKPLGVDISESKRLVDQIKNANFSSRIS